MADTPKQNPFGINAISSLTGNIGFYIQPAAQEFMGTCKYTDNADAIQPLTQDDYQPGRLINDTILKWPTYAMNDGFRRGAPGQYNPVSPGATGPLNLTTLPGATGVTGTTSPASTTPIKFVVTQATSATVTVTLSGPNSFTFSTAKTGEFVQPIVANQPYRVTPSIRSGVQWGKVINCGKTLTIEDGEGGDYNDLMVTVSSGRFYSTYSYDPFIFTPVEIYYVYDGIDNGEVAQSSSISQAVQIQDDGYYVFSVFVKYGDIDLVSTGPGATGATVTDYLQLCDVAKIFYMYYENPVQNGIVYFDPKGLIVGSPGWIGVKGTDQDALKPHVDPTVGNGWYRISIVVNASSGTKNFVMGICNDIQKENVALTVSSDLRAFFWGAQVERLNTPDQTITTPPYSQGYPTAFVDANIIDPVRNLLNHPLKLDLWSHDGLYTFPTSPRNNPIGGTTVYRVQQVDNGSSHYCQISEAGIAVEKGKTYTYSLYVNSNVPEEPGNSKIIGLMIEDSDAQGNKIQRWACYDVNGGGIATSNVDKAYIVTNSGDPWQRVVLTTKLTSAKAGAYIYIVRGGLGYGPNYGRHYASMYASCAQFELGDKPTVFQDTETFKSKRAGEVINYFVAPTTFSSNAWNKDFCLITPKCMTAPDGTLKDADMVTTGYTMSSLTYNNLVNMGKDSAGNDIIPALGNSPPDIWKTDDPSGVWKNAHPEYVNAEQAGAPANAGYPFNNWGDSIVEDLEAKYRKALAYKTEGQLASWWPWKATVSDGNKYVPNRSITMWGWLRAFPLQAWNEFNFNGQAVTGPLDYSNFCYSFSTVDGFQSYNNTAITAIQKSKTFLYGTFSNQNDLISADVLGVCLASREFGQDLINLGAAVDLSLIKTFGLPSSLLQTLFKNNALTSSLAGALLTIGLNQTDIKDISSGMVTANKDQEQKIYSAMLVITGPDLAEILLTLNCRTKGIDILADLLNIKKIFPLSYAALTVPIYNTQVGLDTNSKTYYPLYKDGELNPDLQSPPIQAIVSTITPPAPPAPPVIPELPELVLAAHSLEIATNTRSVSGNVSANGNVSVGNLISSYSNTGNTSTPIGGGGSGGSVGCPAPWINITLADGSTIKASDIEPGMLVYTRHEDRDEWGAYPVTAKELATDTRWKVLFKDGTEFVGTYNHRVLTENGWRQINDLRLGDRVLKKTEALTVDNAAYYDQGQVVKITVQDAHTYLTEGFLSHNIKLNGGDEFLP